MCGIVGWADFERNLAAEYATIRAMTATMALRGPDDEGVWLDERIALGHRRLAVIDIRGGVQPMTAQRDGTVAAVLTYSGEVYNFRELRTELRGFRTDSDTEVVLRAYLQWATRSSSGYAASSPSACGTARASGWSWAATGWASSRCTTGRPSTGCCSPPSRRGSWPTPAR